MRPVLLAAFLALFHCVGRSQTCQWANSLGSVNTVTRIEQVRSYPGSMAIVCGSFAAPSLTLGAHAVTNQGQEDGFVAIANADGEYVWAKGIGGGNNDLVTDVASHSTGEFVAVGNFRSVFLSIGDTTLSNAGESDIHLTKFNADHTIAWVRHFGGVDIDEATSVRMDASGNTYVAGQVTNRFLLQTTAVFVRKYAPNGSLIWERLGTVQSGSANVMSLAVDDQQKVHACGSMYGSITFGSSTLNGDQGFAAFIVSYDPSGTLSNSMVTYDHGEFSAIESREDHIYACARKVNFGIGWGWPLGDSKVKLIKFDSDLNTIWSREFGGVVPNHSLDLAKDLSLDTEGNVYVTGSFFSDTLFFADDTLINPYNAPYYYPQIFVAKYSAAGDAIWGMSAGGIHTDEATGIHVVGNDRFFLAGNFESDPAGFGGYELQNTSQLDSIYVHLLPARYGRRTMGFLAKFTGDNSTGTDDRTDQRFSLWPNPANGSITMRTSPTLFASFTMEIVTLDGRVLHHLVQRSPSSDVHLEISDLAPGPYFVSITTEEGRSTQRFIKY